jgi:hypothetical protein
LYDENSLPSTQTLYAIKKALFTGNLMLWKIVLAVADSSFLQRVQRRDQGVFPSQ